MSDWSDYKITFKDGTVKWVGNVNVFEHLLASPHSSGETLKWDTIECTPKNYRHQNCYGRSNHKVIYKMIDNKPVEIFREEVSIYNKEEEQIEQAKKQYEELTGEQLELF